ncbi:hypothetical protein Ancab_038709 [Ancistrocladus abbreviatus]
MQSVQRFSREKAKYKHRSKGCSVSEVQAFQRDGHSGDSPPLFQVKNPKEHRGNCLRQQSLSSQQMDREKEDNGNRHNGPGFIGPSKSDDELSTSLQGIKAHCSQDFPTQEETAPREIKNRSQQSSQLGFSTLPRNRKKLPMLLGVRRRQPVKGKKRRQKEKAESVSSSQKNIDNSIEGIFIGDSNIANMNRIFL